MLISFEARETNKRIRHYYQTFWQTRDSMFWIVLLSQTYFLIRVLLSSKNVLIIIFLGYSWFLLGKLCVLLMRAIVTPKVYCNGYKLVQGLACNTVCQFCSNYSVSTLSSRNKTMTMDFVIRLMGSVHIGDRDTNAILM